MRVPSIEGPIATPQAEQPVAEALGVNLYAKQLVDGRDRPQLERLPRYVMRPPLSQERVDPSRFAPPPAVADQLQLGFRSGDRNLLRSDRHGCGSHSSRDCWGSPKLGGPSRPRSPGR